jgi:hypothetical protein
MLYGCCEHQTKHSTWLLVEAEIDGPSQSKVKLQVSIDVFQFMITPSEVENTVS